MKLNDDNHSIDTYVERAINGSDNMWSELKMDFVPFSIAKQTLHLNESSLIQMLQKNRIEIFYNENDEKCIERQVFKKLCYDNEVIQQSKKDLLKDLTFHHNTEKATGKQIRKDIDKQIFELKNYTDILKQLHSKYNYKVDVINGENALTAAYLLFSKVISLLNMAISCLDNHYFNTGALFRIIDETIDVAEYFIISEGTSEGVNNLKKWFHEDEAPKHSKCRQQIAAYQSSILQDRSINANRDISNELYHLKSKMVHPCRNYILESLKFRDDLDTAAVFIDYEDDPYSSKIYDLTVFFRSTI